MKRLPVISLFLLLLIALAQNAPTSPDARPGVTRANGYEAGKLGSVQQPAPTDEGASDSVYSVGSYPLYTPPLAPGKGADLVESYCQVCHSTAYITQQPPLSGETWASEVHKMVESYGAPVPDQAAEQIIDYLQTHYTAETIAASTKAAAQTPASPAAPAPEKDVGADQEVLSAGKTTYESNCASCHQATGQGAPGAFPPLVDHAPELYNAENGKTYLADLLLYGLQGEIDVGGQAYNGVMPAWAQLSDQEIADVLNYILTDWDNRALLPDDFTPYAAADVAAQRDAGLSAQQVLEARGGLGLK